MLGIQLGLELNRDFVKTFSALSNRYEERVEADGGNVESKECLTQDYSVYNWSYYFRVTDDGGNVENLDCVPITY